MKSKRPPGIEPIGLAAMYSEASIIKRDTRGIVLTGSIFAADLGDVSAHVKIPTGNGRRLYAECLGSAMAHALGLSVPRTYLVAVTPTALPELDAPTWGFGTLTVHPAVASPLQNNDSEVYAAIQYWANFHTLCVLDEWLANDDRTPENLLFDGRDFILLDHGEAIPDNLSARVRAPCGNHQLDRACLVLSEFEKHQALKRLKLSGAAIPALPLHHAKNALNVHWTTDGEVIIDEMITFLLERVPHLDTLLRKALNLPIQTEKLL